MRQTFLVLSAAVVSLQCGGTAGLSVEPLPCDCDCDEDIVPDAAAPDTGLVQPEAWGGPTTPWRFGILADTQWTVSDDGRNPNGVAVDLINQVNQAFIARAVDFVVQVGDLENDGTASGLDTRATYAQALYNAGIGFFPLRGNHDGSANCAAEFRRVFPQTKNGRNNATPSDALVSTPDDPKTRPARKSGSAFTIGSDFSSPSSRMSGLSYAFSHKNVRLVLLDQYTPPDGGDNSIAEQQSWIDQALDAAPSDSHVMLFSHEGLINQSHIDTLFGGDPSEAPEAQDAFIDSFERHGGRYLFNGHDHLHNRALISTTDGSTALQDIICTGDSSKFYDPRNPSNDEEYDLPAFGRTRETPISQELDSVGFYIVNVDGPRVAVEFHSAKFDGSRSVPLAFQKRETFGYAANGREFVVPQEESYTVVEDHFGNTSASVLAGTNRDTARDASKRPFVKLIDTGWSERSSVTNSDVLTLWGMASRLGSDRTDTYVLSVSFDAEGLSKAELTSGSFGLATRDSAGNWINAASRSSDGAGTFVSGPWKSSAALGTFGVDTVSHRAWAVLDYADDFAVARFAAY